jgi:tubulin--tyrosine ligase
MPSSIDLSPHLTNTSLQTHRGEEGVRLLQELVGCRILSDQKSDRRLTSQDVDKIIKQMSLVLSETFRAASQLPVHFQVSRLYRSYYMAQTKVS